MKTKASALDKSYTDEYENRVKSQRQQAEDLYKKARETNDAELELKSVELLNKVSLRRRKGQIGKNATRTTKLSSGTICNNQHNKVFQTIKLQCMINLSLTLKR